MVFLLRSAAFSNNGVIPEKHTYEGQNISPRLEWEAPPKDTESFILIVDSNEEEPELKNHWIIYNISKYISHLDEGLQHLSCSAKMGTNS